MIYPAPAHYSRSQVKKKIKKDKIKEIKLMKTIIRKKEKVENSLRNMAEISVPSTSDMYFEKIDSRREDFYFKIATYFLMLQIRDLLYRGTNPYHTVHKRKAIQWFKSKNYTNIFGYGMICMMLEINAEKLWLQIRRWIKVDPDYLSSALKSAESGIFDGPKLANMRREGSARRIGEKDPN